MQIIETKVYNFTELNDEAKEVARNWYRENTLDYDWRDSVYEDARQCAEILGIDIDRIYFSGFSSQGDGACFEGTYQYKKGAPKEIKKYAPLDTTLYGIAKALQIAQQKVGYRAEATVTHRGHHCHSKSNTIDVYVGNDYYISTEDDIIKALRDFMDWIYRKLEEAYEYLISDESIAEHLINNEYTFKENGERFE